MLKKVVGAAHLKDRLKNRLYHAPPTAGSRHNGPRYHSGRGGAYKQTAMSFSSVDNEAFEQILDDDSDFIAVGKAPPTQSSVAEGSNVVWPANTSNSSAESQHSDLFDDDMFDDQTIEDFEDESPEASAPVVNYDPLSGQIVSQPVSSNSSDGDNDGMGIGNETEPSRPVEEDGAGDDEGGEDHMTLMNSRDGPRVGRASESEETDEKLEGTERKLEETEAEDTGVKALDYESHEYLFDEGPDDPLTESPADASFHSVEDSEPVEPVDGMDMPHSYESPVSSFPSSVETDPYWQGNSVHEVPEVPETEQNGSNSQPTGTRREEVQSQAESSIMSDLEAELEQLLAPRPGHAPRVGVSKDSPGVVRRHQRPVVAQQGPSSDREGTHLDSGVFEHDDRRDSTLSVGGEATGVTTAHDEGNDGLFPSHDDHFSRPKDRSATLPTVSTCHSSKPSNQASKKNSSGRAPPPRPPISPQFQKRMTKSAAMSSHVTESDRVVPKLVRPLGRVVGTQAEVVGKVEEGGGVKEEERRGGREEGPEARRVEEPLLGDDDDDELFPDDIKKMREMDRLVATKAQGDPAPLIHNTIEQVGPTSQPLDTTTPKGTEAGSAEAGREESEFHLSIEFHLLLSLVLYLYYSLNIFPYLAGVFAGFLMLYVCLGSVFIYYVETIEKEQEERQQERKQPIQVSDDFVQTMKVDFSKLKEYHVSVYSRYYSVTFGTGCYGRYSGFGYTTIQPTFGTGQLYRGAWLYRYRFYNNKE